MPVYEYNCKAHGVFDVVQSMTDEHVALCPRCHKPAMRVFVPFPLLGDLPSKPKAKPPRPDQSHHHKKPTGSFMVTDEGKTKERSRIMGKY